MNNPYPTQPDVNKGELPDPFEPPEAQRVSSPGQWPEAAEKWKDLIINLEYGGLPPYPESVTYETLCHNRRKRWPGKPCFRSYKVHCHGGEQPFSFTVQILFPETDTPVPAIIRGDGCWWCVSEDIALNIIRAGCALVNFNRTEMAEDLGYGTCPDPYRREGGLYDVFPCFNFGALAAWAWDITDALTCFKSWRS